MIAGLYAAGTWIAGPAVRLVLAVRRARGKEDRQRIGERFGRAGLPRPDGPLVWLHGASVGEAVSALPLIDRMLADNAALNILVTTGTVTSAQLMAERLPRRAFHQYIPVDLPASVASFLDYWRPDLALWLESELWPNLLRGAERRGVPMVLVNGRMSARSFAQWRRIPQFAARLLGAFDQCLAQSEPDAERFTALGAQRVTCRGNLKYAATPLPSEPGDLKTVEEVLGGRPHWLAASTHPGEEGIIAEAHLRLRQGHSALLTIIAPRHPGRGTAIAAELRAAGLRVAQRSAGQAPDTSTDVYLADTLGELGLFYRSSPIAFIGGSLVPHGGQNLLEPAQLDCAILHGPGVFNFAAIADAMAAAGGATIVSDAKDLADAVDSLLTDETARKASARSAATVAASEAGVLDRIIAALAPSLDRLRSNQTVTKADDRARA